MEFWIFMFFMDLLIPLTMIVFGHYFMHTAPKKINAWFGYRTKMSMKNCDTWIFAHQYCGKCWLYLGLLLLPLTIIIMVLVSKETNNTIGIVGLMICLIQMIPLIGAIVPTEIALKRTFDQKGKENKSLINS